MYLRSCAIHTLVQQVLSSYACLDSDLKFQQNGCLLLILDPNLHILWSFFINDC